MKMAKWIMTDDKKGIVQVLKGDLPEAVDKKEVFSNSKVKFNLIYSATHKLVGYQLNYVAEKNLPKFKTYNSYGIVYNKNEKVNQKTMKMEILYEDQVLRLLSFKHGHNVRDFWLVGRWRIEAEAEVEEEIDA